MEKLKSSMEFGQGYGKTYNHIMRSGLSKNAKVVYAVLAGYADENRTCSPGVGTLICDCGLCKSAFYKGMKELEKTGIVSIERDESEERGRIFQKNVYTLHDTE